MSSTADTRFGIGYRKPIPVAMQGVASSLDVHLGADLGHFDSVTVTQAGSSASADIPDDARSLHYAFTLDFAWHLAL